MASGKGIYFDGKTSARREVEVEAAPDALRISAPDGTLLAEWPYQELMAFSAPADVLRLGRRRDSVLARLDVRDAELAGKIDVYAHGIDRSGVTERRTRNKIIAWTFAATVSLIFVAIVVLPAVVERLAPLIPMSVESRLGAAVDAQVRAMLATEKSDRPFECGGGSAREQAGREAFNKLIGRMEQAAGLPIPVKAAVVRRSESNAIALPGGSVYVFQGLITAAQSPDELAGVLAHELGHVAHRDGTRSILQAAGLSFLFGMLLGDFTGGGLVVLAARKIVESSYSREAESAADRYSVELIAKIGGDARALASILERIAGAIEPGINLLRDHPVTKERVALIHSLAPPRRGAPLLSADEWVALKRICG
jgi:Zn-dependent protease with chaperone function